jgi:hypothetical protein
MRTSLSLPQEARTYAEQTWRHSARAAVRLSVWYLGLYYLDIHSCGSWVGFVHPRLHQLKLWTAVVVLDCATLGVT